MQNTQHSKQCRPYKHHKYCGCHFVLCLHVVVLLSIDVFELIRLIGVSICLQNRHHQLNPPHTPRTRRFGTRNHKDRRI